MQLLVAGGAVLEVVDPDLSFRLGGIEDVRGFGDHLQPVGPLPREGLQGLERAQIQKFAAWAAKASSSTARVATFSERRAGSARKVWTKLWNVPTKCG